MLLNWKLDFPEICSEEVCEHDFQVFFQLFLASMLSPFQLTGSTVNIFGSWKSCRISKILDDLPWSVSITTTVMHISGGHEALWICFVNPYNLISSEIFKNSPQSIKYIFKTCCLPFQVPPPYVPHRPFSRVVPKIHSLYLYKYWVFIPYKILKLYFVGICVYVPKYMQIYKNLKICKYIILL